MGLKTPTFWYKPALSPLAALLMPASLLYRAGLKCARCRKGRPYAASIPVFCVGNIVAGGSGKTPVALALAALLKRNGMAENPFFLTRGYGGTVRHPVLVAANHRADQVGDEPLLLARAAATVVSPDRAAGAMLAEQNGADALIMDDGLTNPSLIKTVSFIVIDGAVGFGNRHVMPAGPLRVPLGDGLTMADAFIVIGGTVPPEVPATGKPVFQAVIETAWKPSRDTYIAFTGLGRPVKFFDMLRSLGANLKNTQAFSDHHTYTQTDIDNLEAAAHAANARLITTEKDAVRLPHNPEVESVPITLRFKDESVLVSFLQEKLQGRHENA